MNEDRQDYEVILDRQHADAMAVVDSIRDEALSNIETMFRAVSPSGRVSTSASSSEDEWETVRIVSSKDELEKLGAVKGAKVLVLDEDRYYEFDGEPMNLTWRPVVVGQG